MQLWHYEPAPLSGEILDVYRKLACAIGSSEFSAQVGAAIGAIAPIDRFYLSERNGIAQRPRPMACRIEGTLAGKIGKYFERYYRRDPVSHALEAAAESTATIVMRVSAEDIVDAEYRRQFFDAGGTVERVSFVHRASDTWLSMNVARHAPLGRFNAQEIGALANLSQLLLPLAMRQAKLEQVNRPSISALEHRFGTQFPTLTCREQQVCARTTMGMTSEATAIDLGIGVGSVQTYRRRAFRRLGISSAFELAPLVMQ